MARLWHWTTQPSVSKVDIVQCKCKSGRRKTCSCVKNKLVCIKAYGCSGHCHNPFTNIEHDFDTVNRTWMLRFSTCSNVVCKSCGNYKIKIVVLIFLFITSISWKYLIKKLYYIFCHLIINNNFKLWLMKLWFVFYHTCRPHKCMFRHQYHGGKIHFLGCKARVLSDWLFG